MAGKKDALSNSEYYGDFSLESVVLFVSVLIKVIADPLIIKLH